MAEREFFYEGLLRSGNKYALTLAVARRARQLHEGATPLVDTDEKKPVVIALEEFSAGILAPNTGEQPEREEEEASEE